MVDLRTTYLGLELDAPLVVASSPLSTCIAGAFRLADAGAGAIVLYSLFEEQRRHASRALHHFRERGARTHVEALTYGPDLAHDHVGPDAYVEHVAAAVAAVDIPVIGSLNGSTVGGWIEYARLSERVGAAALALPDGPSRRRDRAGASPGRAGRGRHRTSHGPGDRQARAVSHVAATPVPAADRCRGTWPGGVQSLPSARSRRRGVRGGAKRVPEHQRRPAVTVALGRHPGGAHRGVAGSERWDAYAVKAVMAGADAVMMASAPLAHGPGALTGARLGLSDGMAAHDESR